MLSGHVVLEDTSVSWTQVENGDQRFHVTVKNLLPDGTVQTAQFICPGKPFMTALATAISWDGDVPAGPEEFTAWWADVEKVAALCPIRWMP